MRILLIIFAVLSLWVSVAGAESAHSLAKDGALLYWVGKYDLAVKKFLAAQVEAPEDTQMSYNLGNAYYKTGDYANAARNFLQSANSKNSALAEKSYYNLGNTHYRMGRLDEAIAYYKRALELAPKDEDAKKNLTFVQKQLQQKQKQPQGGGEKSDKEKEKEQKSGQQQNSQQSQGQQGKDQQSQDKTGQKGQEADDKKKGNVESAQKQNQEKKQGEGTQKNATQQTASKISDEQAQQWLNTLNEDKQKYINMQIMKNQQQYQGRQVEKDW